MISGTIDKPVDGIEITRITGTCQRGSIIQNARNVVLADIHLEGISGPSYFTNNVEGKGLEAAVPFREPPPANGSAADSH